MTIELSQDDFELLILALAMAAGSRSDNPSIFRALIRLANTINKDNPNWTPYEVPDEPTPERVQ